MNCAQEVLYCKFNILYGSLSFLCVQIKAYAEKYPKSGQENAQRILSNVTLPQSFCATFDPWLVIVVINTHMCYEIIVKELNFTPLEVLLTKY